MAQPKEQVAEQPQDGSNREQPKRQESDEATSYSGASTSRLVSTPVEKCASESSRNESEKAVKLVSPSSEQAAVQSTTPKDNQETVGHGMLQRAFRGLIRKREGELVRRIVPEQPAPAAPAAPAPRAEPVVYVEKKGFLSGLTVAEAVFAFNFADEEAPVLTQELLVYWRICSVIRAVCASAAWLLLALRPDCNVLGDTIKKTAVAEMLQRNNDLLEEVPYEYKGQLARMLGLQQ
ncbi:unnamed protein product [Strongylus vulgaris]|uniref:Uncharacterized protein n=1 Tax=Strongylus vulgaris TaxID=40348 RepID=A0A3P7L749_STRVU|nr:unnamed protein product [Strongylus vulgaris]